MAPSDVEGPVGWTCEGLGLATASYVMSNNSYQAYK